MVKRGKEATEDLDKEGEEDEVAHLPFKLGSLHFGFNAVLHDFSVFPV